jgi:hypothetical protein
MSVVGIHEPQPTPSELADELAVRPLQVRNFIRARFPRPESEVGSSYSLTVEQVAAIRAYFADRLHHREPRQASSGAVSGRTSTPYHEDWAWEGNVQAAVRKWLESQGWTIESEANSASREQGDDLRATKGGETLVVEVKGFPPTNYADPRRAGEVKRTRPAIQAKHWFAEALLRTVRVLGTRPQVAVAMAFPEHPRYLALVNETRTAVDRLGIAVLMVSESGRVSVIAGTLEHARKPPIVVAE